MLPTHWIEWIDLIADGKTYRQFLKPGDKPEAVFCVEARKSRPRALRPPWVVEEHDRRAG